MDPNQPNQNEGYGSGTVNNVNNVSRSAYNKSRRLRGFYRTVKTLRVTSVASSWWVPAVFALCFAFGLFFYISMTAEGGTGGGGGGGDGGGGGSGGGNSIPGTPPPCTDIDQRLLADFGVIIKPISEFPTCSDKQKIYSIYSIPFQSPTYKQYIKPSTPFTLEFYSLFDFNKSFFGCTTACGLTNTAHRIQLGGFVNWLNNYSFKSSALFIIHETGHLISHRNYFFESFPVTSLASANPSCYDRGYLITYSLRCIGAGCKITPKHESFAEANSLYIFNSKVGAIGTINNFMVECNATYTWIKTNLFGDTIVKP